MKNQEGEKLEEEGKPFHVTQWHETEKEEGNRLVTLEWSWILMRMDSTYDLGL